MRRRESKNSCTLGSLTSAIWTDQNMNETNVDSGMQIPGDTTLSNNSLIPLTPFIVYSTLFLCKVSDKQYMPRSVVVVYSRGNVSSHTMPWIFSTVVLKLSYRGTRGASNLIFGHCDNCLQTAILAFMWQSDLTKCSVYWRLEFAS